MTNETSSAMSMIVAIIAIVAILVIAYYAVQAFSSSDATPKDPDVNIELNGDANGGTSDNFLY